eukprot:scaffold9427_cov183-Skeletonema_dohrnii-CCMP3373.AAC.2
MSLEEVSTAEHQAMAVIVDPSPPTDPSPPAATKGGTTFNDGTIAIAIAANAESEEVHLPLLPILPMYDGCVVLNGTCTPNEKGWHLQGVWANSSDEYYDQLTEPYFYTSTSQSDDNNSISIMDAEFRGHFQYYYDENVEDKFTLTLQPSSSTDSCTYFEGKGRNKFMSYDIIGVLSGDQITMVRLSTDDADAMDDGEPDGGENGTLNGESEKVIEERPPPTILNLGHVISLRGECQTLEGGSTKIDGKWAEHMRMLTNDDICHRFSYTSETANAPPREGQYNGIFFNAGMGGDPQQHNDTFSLTFTENYHGTYNVEGRGYNELAGDYIVSGIMIGSDITMQRHLIDVNEEGTKRVQSEAKLPSTAEVKEPGKGSKRRKKEKSGSTKTDKSLRKIVTNMKNKVKNKVVEVAAKLSAKPRWSVVLVDDDCVLVDPKNKSKNEPWYNQIKVLCPDAHPEKKTVWVCMVCREEKKDLSPSRVKAHFESRHSEEYKELCALESSRDEQFNQLVLVDPKNKSDHEPWYTHIKVYCPDAHPKKQATTMQKTVWVCMFCREEKKDLKIGNVKKHFESRHPEEYAELCALESSPLFQETLQQQRDEQFNQLVLVDPKNKSENEPWYKHIKVYCPDAHPKKQATTMLKTAWVCMFCRGETMGLTRSRVMRHLERRHPEEYAELCAQLCALESSIIKAIPKVDVVSADPLLENYFQIFPVKSHPELENMAHCTICECNCPLDRIHQHVSSVHPIEWNAIEEEYRGNGQSMLLPVKEET